MKPYLEADNEVYEKEGLNLPHRPLIDYFRKLNGIYMSKEAKEQLIRYSEFILERVYKKLGIILRELMPITRKTVNIEHWEKAVKFFKKIYLLDNLLADKEADKILLEMEFGIK